MHTNVLLQAGDTHARAIERYTDNNYDWIVTMARLRPGVSAAQAQAALGPVFSAWKAGTDTKRPSTELPTLIVKQSSSGLDSLRRTYTKPLYLLLALVGLIQAIACANIANLLLARAAARSKEMAVRLSLGAGRLRVIRQLLTESVLLSAVGSALGVLLAVWAIRFLMLLFLNGRGDIPFAFDIGLNWRVLSAVAALAILTGVSFGLAPAIRSTRVDLTPALKASKAPGVGASTAGRVTIGRALVVSQVAFTLLVLVAAGLFLRTLANLHSLPLGFNPEQVLTFQLNARQAGHVDPEIQTFYEQLSTELNAIPGVRSVAFSDLPLLGAGWASENIVTAGSQPKLSPIVAVGPDFFRTMQVPLLRGRAIESRDRPGAPYVAVVNQQFAKAFFGAVDPIGQHVRVPQACSACDIEIVGISANTRYGYLKETPTTTMFLSYAQAASGPISDITYQLRTDGDPLSVSNAVREIVEHADARVPIMRLKTQRALIDAEINQEVTFARLCTMFALLALAIACIGLYGTMSYGVVRRTNEIGIRIALGAHRTTIMWMVLREVLILAAVGLAVSLPIALIASRLVESFLYGMQPNDPLALAAAVFTMIGAAVIAGYIPARHASRIPPMMALRYE
jgi:predicted permease